MGLICIESSVAIFSTVKEKNFNNKTEYISLSPILDCFPTCDVVCLYDHVPFEYKLARTGAKDRVMSGAETESNILLHYMN